MLLQALQCKEKKRGSFHAPFTLHDGKQQGNFQVPFI